jgi:hypothetical protein
VEKSIKEMRNKKAIREDDVLGDVLKSLGEDGWKIMIKLINTIYTTGVAQGLQTSYNDCLNTFSPARI